MANWVNRLGMWIAKEPTRPGIWRRRDGGYYLRRRVTDPATGKLREITMSLPDADLTTAEARLEQEIEWVRSGDLKRPNASKTRFAEYAALLLERKIATREINSSQTLRKWKAALTRELVPTFGDIFLEKLKASHVETWKVDALKRPRPPRKLKSGKLGK